MRPSQFIGLILWRTGLLILGSYAFFRIARLALKHVDLPGQVEVGTGMVLAGVGLFFSSLIAERVIDGRSEGSPTD